MLNLVYQNTQDERVYAVLSERIEDWYDIFESLPDNLEQIGGNESESGTVQERRAKGPDAMNDMRHASTELCPTPPATGVYSLACRLQLQTP